MLELRLLGPLTLRSADGTEVEGVLTQPRRLALLAFLAAATPRGPQRRDRLAALFSPELDQEHARASLRQALHVLRGALGQDAIVSRGDEDLALNGDVLRCDVIAFDDAVRAARWAEALDLYRGELLDGFFIEGAPEFEHWLDGERARLRQALSRAAHARGDELVATGDTPGAVTCVREVLRHAPLDEALVRRLIALLDAQGDRAAATAAYETFARRLASDLDVQPAPETVALIASVRSRQAPNRTSAPIPTLAAAQARGAALPAAIQPAAVAQRRRWRWVAVSAAVALTAVAAVAVARGRRESALNPRRVVVATFINRTGDSTLDVLGDLAADWITRQLARTGVVELADPGPGLRAFGADPGRRSVENVAALAQGTGSALAVSGAYYRRGDSVEFQTRITDERHGTVARTLDPVAAPGSDPRGAIDPVSERVAAALATMFDRHIAEWAGLTSQPPSLEAYRAFSAGVESWFDRLDAREALPYFYRAAALDTTFTLPLVWAAYAHRGLRECDRTDSLVRALTPRLERLAPIERQLLDRETAICHGDADGAYRASAAIHEAAPGSEMFAKDLAREALGINHPREARDLLLKLHPDRGVLRVHTPYHLFLATADHLLGDHDRELAAAQRARRQFPDRLGMLRIELLAQAALGHATDVERGLAEVAASRPGPFRTPGVVMREAVLELMAHGNADAGRRMLGEVLQYHRSRPAEERATDTWRLDYVLTLMAAERWDEALPTAESLLARQPTNVHYIGIAGALAAARGDRPRAETAARTLETMRQPYLRGADFYWRACIATRLGERAAAVALLQQALEQGWRLPETADAIGVWDLHIDPCFASLRSYPPFEALLRPEG
jgi:DNA-binding SARP family transcriptional activator